MILVVTNIDDTGAAIGLIAHGPPTPKTPNQNPANYVSFAGAVTDHGLTFEAYGGNWHYTFQLRQDGLMEGRASGPKNIHPTITIERID